MIRIHFSRKTDIASHPSFEGFGGDFTARSSDPYFDVIRQMVDAGWPDDCAVFIDERDTACLETKSIHACAKRYRPTDAQRVENAAERKRTEAERKADRAMDAGIDPP